jgi:hypothetical protein
MQHFSVWVVYKRVREARRCGRMTTNANSCRHMDLIMYVLYSQDQRFVYDMVCRVVREVSDEYSYAQLADLLQYEDRPVLFRCLFFLTLNFHAKFRYWVLSTEASNCNGLPPISPHKMCRFLVELRETIIPNFLVDEVVTMDDLDRTIKVSYIAS